MKLTVDTKEFAGAIAWVEKAIATKPANYLLSYVKLSSVESSIKIEGSNLAINLTQELAAKVERAGSILVPAKLLAELVIKLPEGDLLLETEGERINLAIGKLLYTLPILSSDEYPNLSEIDANPLLIDGVELRQSLAATIYAAANEETKGIISGVRFWFKQDELELTATDGHRIAIATCPCDNTQEEKIVIPASGLELLLPVLPKEGEGHCVEMRIGKINLSFSIEGRTLTFMKLSDYVGDYPAIEEFLPQDYIDDFACDRKALIECLSRMKLATEKHLVQFEIKPELAKIYPHWWEKVSGTEEITISLFGTQKDFLANIVFVLDAIRKIDEEEIYFAFSPTPSKPLLLHASKKQAKHYIFLAVIPN